MELIGIEEIMDLLQIGRKRATKYLNTKGCPVLPRKKGETYKVQKEAFLKWIAEGGKR